MENYLADVFDSCGVLAKKFAGYSPRAGQVALASEVDRAIRERGHLIAEAGTGTGKSIAYAVPAAYHAARLRREAVEAGVAARTQAVLVTANIALQEQLYRKDLPLLAEILPWKFTYALLKGVKNYICLDKLKNGAKGRCAPSDLIPQKDIVSWAARTTTGDKSELPFEPSEALWSRFSVSADDCVGDACEFYGECYSKNAKRKAALADVIVTNYDLFFLDLQIRAKSGGQAGILPPYAIVVMDEGHEAADKARDKFGFQIGEGSLHWAAGMLPPAAKTAVGTAAGKFFADLLTFGRSDQYKARIRKPNAVPWENLTAALGDASRLYSSEIKTIDPDSKDKATIKHLRKLEKRLNRTTVLRWQITAAMTFLPPEPVAPWVAHPNHPAGEKPETRWYWSDPKLGGTNEVKNAAQIQVDVDEIYFIEEDRGEAKLCSKPVSVATILRDLLFRTVGSVSITSATLAARGSFDYVIQDLGAEVPATARPALRTLIAESPFTWSDQALLVLPTDVPDPKDYNAFGEAAADKCAQVIELARGRTLALFTSRRNMEIAYKRALGADLGYRILKQGDMPRTQLIDAFRRDVNSVLLGVASFWAGVDVPGESLSCVFIDKLPFTPPTDALLDALSERDPKGVFLKHSVPRAIIEFKQGFGRLIRTTTDRGVVVCLDRRITTMFYGRQFIASLPPVARSSKIEDVRNFLDGNPIVPELPRVANGGRSLFD